MTNFKGSKNFEHGKKISVGVLLCNLGTPDKPTRKAVKRYLAEFLSDPRIVELPRILWLPILHGIILNTRPSRSARAYSKIWTKSGSPLLFHSKNLKTQIERDLDSWVMNLAWTPFGTRQSWFFFIGVRSGFLSDLKYDKRREPDKRL